MTLRAIWAQASSGAIGADGGMPWHLPEDMAFFKATTVGHPVIMGRRTWESFPERFRPLPGRENVVVTRNEAYRAPGATLAPSLEAAIAHASAIDDEVWVIGGATIYADAMPLLDELRVTEIDIDVMGDAFAPEIGDEWRLESSDPADGWHVGRGGLPYRFRTYRRAS